MSYNRFNVNILCIADSEDVTELQSKILAALKTVPKLTVKATNFDTWTDGMTGSVREYDENGEEIVATTDTSTTTDTTTTDTTDTTASA